MRKLKMKQRQKMRMSMQARLVIGTSCFLLIATGFFIAVNLGDVKESKAGINGNFRAIASGNWEDTAIWEQHDGKKWQHAENAPESINKIIIQKGTTITVNENAKAENIVVEKGAALNLKSEFFTLSKAGKMQVEGTVDLGKCIVDGEGSFNANNEAIVIIGSPEGLNKTGSKGNIQVKGGRAYSRSGMYIFLSDLKQLTGNGLPYNLENLIIDNPQGVEMESNLSITSVLHLKKGVLSTGNYLLSLGADMNNTGAMKRDEGSIKGNLKRWMGPGAMKEALFPLSDGKNYNGIFMTVNSNDFRGGTFTFSFAEGKAKKENNADVKKLKIIYVSENGSYNVIPADGFENCLFKMYSSVSLSKFESKNYWLISGKPVAEASRESQSAVPAEKISAITVAPNPFKDQFRLNFNLYEKSEVTIDLLNAGGQLMFTEKIMGEEGSNLFEFRDERNFAPGVYFLNIKIPGKSESRKLIKN